MMMLKAVWSCVGLFSVPKGTDAILSHSTNIAFLPLLSSMVGLMPAVMALQEREEKRGRKGQKEEGKVRDKSR